MKMFANCVLAGVVAFAVWGCSSQGAQTPPVWRPPRTGSPTERMVALRKHAWDLWETIASMDPPLMESQDWFQGKDAFRPPTESSLKSMGLMLYVPKEMTAAPPTVRGDFAIYESTFYNRAAREHILNEELYKAAKTDELLERSRREIPEFPRDAVVVKTFWRLLPETGNAKVGVWTWKKLPDGAARITEDQWNTLNEYSPVCVVDGGPREKCISADEFVVATVADPKKFPCAANGCLELLPNQKLILLGMHIATKETPDWFWATFWWQGIHRTSGDVWTCDNAQRPPALSNRGKWSNYSMDVVISFTQPKPDLVDASNPTGECGVPGVIGDLRDDLRAAYNPFVEGVGLLGRKSSCIDCHSRASTAKEANDSMIPDVDSTDQYPGLKHFENHIRLDYLWTLRKRLRPTDD